MLNNKITNLFLKLHQGKSKGAALAEYMIILALGIMVVIGIVGITGKTVQNTYNCINQGFSHQYCSSIEGQANPLQLTAQEVGTQGFNVTGIPSSTVTVSADGTPIGSCTVNTSGTCFVPQTFTSGGGAGPNPSVVYTASSSSNPSSPPVTVAPTIAIVPPPSTLQEGVAYNFYITNAFPNITVDLYQIPGTGSTASVDTSKNNTIIDSCTADSNGNCEITGFTESMIGYENYQAEPLAPTGVNYNGAYNSNVITINWTSPSSSPAWSTPTYIDGSHALTSVSCPTTTFCMAVNTGGSGGPGGPNSVTPSAFTYSNGTWSSLGDIDGSHTLTSVSCPTTTFCMAVDNAGNALTYNTGTWSTTNIDGSNTLTSVSCASTTFCVAVDDLGYRDGSAFTYNGSTWSAQYYMDNANKLTSVSCAPNTTFCMAVDQGGEVFINHNGQFDAPVYYDTGANDLTSVSCASTTFCMVVDGGSNAITYNNGTWSTTNIDGYDSLTSVSVSCPTTTFCMVVGSFSSNPNYAITYNNGFWSVPSEIDSSNTLHSVSCPTTTFCMAVGVNGNSVVYNG